MDALALEALAWGRDLLSDPDSCLAYICPIYSSAWHPMHLNLQSLNLSSGESGWMAHYVIMLHTVGNREALSGDLRLTSTLVLLDDPVL